ncbi:hypothetical protein M569_17730 [Genlisea aurea]|uniref:Uncharacterized protein n=1 Tax=Genlisea aurea TaxID=192259 RepID=S8BR37_9LAMI|nr:hypothetical protein M569_17730 [Genlisea aurea]
MSSQALAGKHLHSNQRHVHDVADLQILRGHCFDATISIDSSNGCTFPEFLYAS